LANPWVLGIGGSLVATGIAWLIRTLLGRRKKQAAAAPVQQDVSPVMTQTFQPIVNIHPSISLEPPPTPRRAGLDTDEPPSRLPRFEFKGSREKPVYISPDALSGITDPHDAKEWEKSIKALLLRFENTSSGGANARAMDVIAKMSFRSLNGVTEQSIDYGVWLNSPCDCTDMDVGDTRELVIICVSDGTLSSFDDRRQGSHTFHSEWSWLDERPVDGLEAVEIRIIDRRTGASQEFALRIGYDGGHFNCGGLN
jgi:hypothetical protein